MISLEETTLGTFAQAHWLEPQMTQAACRYLELRLFLGFPLDFAEPLLNFQHG
jgi:hypothetical protein